MSGIEIVAGITLGEALSAAGTVLGAVSAVAQGNAQAAAAKNTQRVLNAQAVERERQAGQERAVAQRAAAEERRRGRLVSSRAQTVHAASGTGALDPSLADILGDIDQETEIRALNQLYQGEERGRGLEFGAALDRTGGQNIRNAGRVAQTQGYLSAGGTLLEGTSSLFEKYRPRSNPGAYGNLDPGVMGVPGGIGSRTRYY